MLKATDATQKHIVLLKLTELYEDVPQWEGQITGGKSPERVWLGAVGALFKVLGGNYEVGYNTNLSFLGHYKHHVFSTILGLVGDAIEELTLDLELEGRSAVGSAYEPGEVYRFFADLKAIMSTATHRLLVIDPYFDGQAFDAYLSAVTSGAAIHILANRYSGDIREYAKRHTEQYGTTIEIRRSDELHDRLVIVDDGDCWIVGQSIKDAAKKATYLIPLSTALAKAKSNIYSDIWSRAAVVEV